MKFIWLREASRIYFRSMRKRFFGLPVYKGSAEEICLAIVKHCWNKKDHYFQTSTGHFCQFFSRDFSWCIRPLLNTGYEEEVHQTLEYALRRFNDKKKVTVAISPGGKPFDFPTYAVDSLPCLIHSMVEAKANDLIEKYQGLLQNELSIFCKKVLEKSTGLVDKAHFFSSAKDHYQRVSSCYDNVMLGMLSVDLEKIGFHNPLCEYDYKQLLKFNFWTGSAFIDDLSGKDVISGDANVFPYWSGMFQQSSMIKSSIKTVRALKLDQPFPLKYTVGAEEKTIVYDMLTPNYEGTSIWAYLGLLYINLVSKVNKKLAKRYLHQYTNLIERFGNLLEVFDPSGEPYRSRFYFSDDSMLWSAIYLGMVKKLR